MVTGRERGRPPYIKKCDRDRSGRGVSQSSIVSDGTWFSLKGSDKSRGGGYCVVVVGAGPGKAGVLTCVDQMDNSLRIEALSLFLSLSVCPLSFSLSCSGVGSVLRASVRQHKENTLAFLFLMHSFLVRRYAHLHTHKKEKTKKVRGWKGGPGDKQHIPPRIHARQCLQFITRQSMPNMQLKSYSADKHKWLRCL